MTGIFAKLRNITLGNLHSLLNDAIDMNSIPSVEQYLRDLSAGRNQLQDTLATARHDLQVKAGKLEAAKTEDAELVKNIKLLSNSGKVDAAKALAARLGTLRDSGAALEMAVTDAQTQVDQLKGAVDAVKAKETTLNGQLGTLRGKDASAKAKTAAANAIEAVGDLMASGGDVDNLAGRIGAREAVADDRLARATSNLAGPDASTAKAVADAKAEALLAEITGQK